MHTEVNEIKKFISLLYFIIVGECLTWTKDIPYPLGISVHIIVSETCHNIIYSQGTGVIYIHFTGEH